MVLYPAGSRTPWRWTHLMTCTATILTLLIVTRAEFLAGSFPREDREDPVGGRCDLPSSRRENASAEGEWTSSDAASALFFVERDDWGGMPPAEPLAKLQLPVAYVIILHSLTDPCATKSECSFYVRFMQTFHMESRRFSDIAYNFMLGGDGLVYVGRGWDRVGAHTFNFNKRSIGVAFIGTFNSVVPPRAQLDALQRLLQFGVKAGKISPNYKLLGQRQVSKTLSPGDALYNIIKKWPHWSPNP